MHIHLVLSLLCAFVLLNPFPHNIGIDDIRDILGRNAVSWYGLDTEALSSVAERIGPQISQFQ